MALRFGSNRSADRYTDQGLSVPTWGSGGAWRSGITDWFSPIPQLTDPSFYGLGDNSGANPDERNYSNAYSARNLAEQNRRIAMGESPIPSDWQPLSGNIPSFQDWYSAQGAGYQPTGGNDPYYEYFNNYYQLPTNSGDFLSKAGPLAASLAVGGMGAFGPGGFLAGAPAATAAGGEAAALAGSSPLNAANLGAYSGLPALSPEAAGGLAAMSGSTPLGGAAFGASLGTPLATGASALPGWATAAATPAELSVGAPVVAPGTYQAASGSPLGRLLGLGQTGQDWLSVLGPLGATALGVYGANQTGNRLSDLQGQLRQDRLPYLQASQGWLSNPESYFSGPGQAALNSNLQQLSSKYGNPISSPTALGIATEAGLRDWRNAVMGVGELGLGGQGIQAGLGTGAANSYGDVYNTIGGGMGELFNPRRSLSDLVKELKLVY